MPVELSIGCRILAGRHVVYAWRQAELMYGRLSLRTTDLSWSMTLGTYYLLKGRYIALANTIAIS
jgi:hypothetical protein